MKRQIIFSVLISFLISFLLLVIFLTYQYNNEHVDISDNTIGDNTSFAFQKKFYAEIPQSSQKIFIIGSSQISWLNTTQIHNYLLKNYDYQVYNLALSSDTPIQRLETIDLIIDAKPSLVVYGISPRDFQNVQQTTNIFETSTIFSPSPHKIFNDLFDSFTNFFKFNYDLFKSPKFVTLKAIRGTPKSTDELIKLENTPFFSIGIDMRNTKSNLELKSTFIILPQFEKIESLEKNKHFSALKEIIKKTSESNIKVILLVLPQNKIYLDHMSNSDKESFNLILDEFQKKPNVTIYTLFENYKDHSIWHDIYHPAINQNTSFYSEDVAKMILQELN